MPTSIVGLKYSSPFQEVKTEEILLEVFRDLKSVYKGLATSFQITNTPGDQISDFEGFLRYSTYRPGSEKIKPVILRGSGTIAGMSFINATIEYDVSEVEKITRHWDYYSNGSCDSCHNYRRDLETHNEWGPPYCAKEIKPMKPDCEVYDAKRKGPDGRGARPLEKLIIEATKLK